MSRPSVRLLSSSWPCGHAMLLGSRLAKRLVSLEGARIAAMRLWNKAQQPNTVCPECYFGSNTPYQRAGFFDQSRDLYDPTIFARARS